MLGKVEMVVLGLLSDGPRHAYDIVREYHSQAMDKWVSVGDASIYQAMPRLEKEGLIERAPSLRRSNKKVYRLSNAGRKRLREAISSRLSSAAPYDLELNVGVGFIELLKRDEAVRALSDRRKIVLDMVRSMGKLSEDGEDGTRSLPRDMIALQRFILARAELEWLDRTIMWLGGTPG
ncbi:MAG: PadR family transcriptional regulator [Candidatus Aquicultorales bacterium]